MKPAVIATTSSAPSIRGGAGAGISNRRQAMPMTNAKINPTASITSRLPARPTTLDARGRGTLGKKAIARLIAERHRNHQQGPYQDRRRWKRQSYKAAERPYKQREHYPDKKVAHDLCSASQIS